MARSEPSLDSVTTINEDGSRHFIHPADVRGRFTRARSVVGWLLIAVYALLPWVQINGNPAVFLDVAQRQMHLFGLTFVPQDFWLAFFFITGLGFSLFYINALFGRVWCGWTCPQTVFIEQVFRRIERLFEGDALLRRRLDAAPWSGQKLLKRGGKWLIFGILTLAISHLFLSYFVSLPRLYGMMTSSPLEHWGAFLFVFTLSAALFFDFVWFREQFCIIMCPYGRLQSVLIDDDTVGVGYDTARGEPRGKPSQDVVGDCIDCRRCVQVCPTGIDIRQGVQIECLHCANCIDACDQVMARLGRADGLIRYASTRSLKGEKTRLVRPRTFLYTVLLLIGAAVMAVALSGLKPATVTLLRIQGAPYYQSEGMIRNQFLLRIDNKRNRSVHFSVRLNVSNAKLSGAQEGVTVPSHGQEMRPLVVTIASEKFSGGFPVEIEVVADDGLRIVKTVPFLGPGRPQLLMP